MINLYKTEQFSLEENCIFLLEEQNDLLSLNLSSDELTYVNHSIQLKNNPVILNRYKNYLIIQLIDKVIETNENAEIIRKAGHTICQFLQKNKVDSIKIVDKSTNPFFGLSLAEGIILSNYQFLKYVKDADQKVSSLAKIGIISTISQSEIDQMLALSNSVYVARDLVNEPANFLSAVGLSDIICTLAKKSGFGVTVFDKKKIQSMGFGGILSVNKGSSAPPTFTIMEWKPQHAVNEHPIVLVGKGVVYDSGGYSLKPTTDSMDYMKCDMAGASCCGSSFLYFNH